MLKPRPVRADETTMSIPTIAAERDLSNPDPQARTPVSTTLSSGLSPAFDVDQAFLRRTTQARGRGLHGQLVQRLGQLIVSGEMGADEPLVPEEIGHRFDVSRTVVRETLRVLEAKGLVSARPNVGTRIRPVTDWNLLDPDIIEWRSLGPSRGEQLRELNELRMAVEPLAAQLAAGRVDPERKARMRELIGVLSEAVHTDPIAYAVADAELHGLILHASGNRLVEHLAEVVYGALEMTATGRHSCGEPSKAHVDAHYRLVLALTDATAPDPGLAADLLRTLLASGLRTEATLPAQREQQPGR
jgi:DNA-binding FadR family transcriptional regulator